MPASVAASLQVPVVFLSAEHRLAHVGPFVRQRVTTDALPGRLAELAADPSITSGHALAAIPFEPGGDAWVVGGRAAADAALPATTFAPQPSIERVVSLPPRDDYARGVARVLERLSSSDRGSRKVVLSRRLTVHAESPIDVRALVGRLAADTGITTFCLPLELDAPGRVFVGASPETLLAKQGSAVTSSPLAGSARRAADPNEDRAIAARLAGSAKDHREHALVVEWIADRLAPHCDALNVPRHPAVVAAGSLWHLGTHITGTLKERDTPSVQLALDLHPTPAVCGLPLGFALDAIAECEPFDRRFYGGAVGWSDGRGDGHWMVAIRCAEVDGRTAHLYAGAGIVVGSDPEAEADETSAKLRTLLSALGIDEQGHRLAEEPR